MNDNEKAPCSPSTAKGNIQKEFTNVINNIVPQNSVEVNTGYDKEAYKAKKKQERLDNMNEYNRAWALAMQEENANRQPVPWIYEKLDNFGNIKEVVSPQILAECIRKMQDFHYIFVRESAKQGIQRFFYIDGFYQHITDEEMKGYIKQFIPVSLQKMRDINECLNLLYTDHTFYDMDELNADENIINFQNGTLELDTMRLREHRPTDLCTIQLKCNYIVNVPKPEKFKPFKAKFQIVYDEAADKELDEFLESNPNAIYEMDFNDLPKGGYSLQVIETGKAQTYFDYFIDFLTGNDTEIINFLLQYMGVVMSNIKGYRMKKALFMVGLSNAGKSQLKKLVESIIGKANYSSVDLAEIEKRFGTSRIFNKRLSGSSDMSFVTIEELKQFKWITGGDSISAEFKGENGFDFIFNGLLWFCCNRLPKFGGDKGDPIFNRMVVLECNNVATELDPLLQDKMFAERDYIVSLAIQAAKRVVDNGYMFDIPKASKKAVAEFKTDINSFLRFMEDCTEDRPQGGRFDRITPKDIYNIYCAWCKDNGYKYPQSRPEIKQFLIGMGKDEIAKNNGVRYYKYFTVTEDTKEEYFYQSEYAELADTPFN